MNRTKEKSSASGRPAETASNGRERELHPFEDLTSYLKEYSRQRPETVALACLGLGFVLGWKLKLW